MSSSNLVWLSGLCHAVVIAVAAYLIVPGDPTGRPLLVAIAAIIVSTVVTYSSAHRVRAAVVQEAARQAQANLRGPGGTLPWPSPARSSICYR